MTPINQKGLISTVILLLVFLLLSSGVFFYLNSKKQPISGPIIEEHNPVPVAYEEAKEQLTASEIVIKLVDDENPHVALTKLEELIKDESTANVCHKIAHEIGHRAFQKYQDFSEALSYKTEICGSGYIHGVIEERLAKSENILEDIKTTCPIDNDGNCFHGVGHGIMYYSDNDLPKSIAICDEMKTTQNKTFCAEGVFMENFNTDLKIHPSTYLKEDDLYYPCYQQSEFYKGTCYFYAPRYFTKVNVRQYEELVNFCQKAESGFVTSCMTGAGSALIKENINNPSLVESICEKAQPNLINYCLDGMVSYYLVHHFSLSKGRALCESLTEKNRQTCLNSVSKRTSRFPE